MGVDRPIDITPEQRKTILALLERHLPNTTAWVYGSRANWRARPQSDLDMVVFVKPEQSGRVSQLKEAFEQSNLPFRIDLFDWDVVPENFRKQITADYVVLVEREKKEGRKDWKNVMLGDYIEINDDTYSPKDARQQITYLDTGNISENRISEVQSLVVGRDKIPTRAGRKVRTGDMVYSTVRPNQRHYGLLKEPPENLLVSTGFAVIRGKKGLACTEFIYWFLAQDHIVERLHTIAEHSTSAYLSIRPKDIETLTLNLPPLSEQRPIAHVLGTLDDKINLNRRMNEKLEAIARAIFKDWFVDFGPVRAKMDGRAPYLSPELWALFPDALDDEDKPVGWQIGNLGHFFHLTMGQSPPGSTYNNDQKGLPFFQGRTDFGFRYPENRRYCAAPTRIAECDDTLVSVRAPVGNINMAWERCCAGRGVAALRHMSGSRSFTYYSALAVQQELRQYEQAGTVFGSINKGQFEALRVVEPAPEIVFHFESQVGPLDERIRQNVAEIRNLIQTRELLLPKLMSGEIRLPVGEKDLSVGAAKP